MGLDERSRAGALDTVRGLVDVVSWLLSLSLEKAMTLRVKWKRMGLMTMQGSRPLMGLDEGWCEDERRIKGMARTTCRGRDERDVTEGR